jgi:hypothetical protein
MMNRILNATGVVSKVLGSLLLCGGGTFAIGISLGMVLGSPPGWAMIMLSLLLVTFGLLPASLGGLLLYGGGQAKQRGIRGHFFHLLQRNQGRVSLLDFAAQTRLEPTIARRHLDGWAREFLADFEVTEQGDIYYVFSTEQLPLPLAQPAWTTRQLLD